MQGACRRHRMYQIRNEGKQRAPDAGFHAQLQQDDGKHRDCHMCTRVRQRRDRHRAQPARAAPAHMHACEGFAGFSV
jgi:hypothetical protein